MSKFFQNYTFILAFMVFMVFWNMIFGKKATETLLWLILLGMVLTNSGNIAGLVTKSSTTQKSSDTNGTTKQTGNIPVQYL